MKKTMIVASFLALAPFAKGQLLLEALEGGMPFTPSEKCLERVYDKHYGDGEHNFIYCAVQGPNGKKWLNLNLGAEYAKESSPHFNPEAVPTDYKDWKAYGSLFQWGRGADGHELGKYIDDPSTTYWKYEFKYPITTSQIDSNTTSKHSVDNTNGWTTGLNDNIVRSNWSTNNPKNPCPNGYRVIDDADIQNVINGFEIPLDDVYGGPASPSYIPLKNYPNLNLVLSPVLMKSDANVTSSDTKKTNKNEFPGTSTIWLLPDPNSPELVYNGTAWDYLDPDPYGHLPYGVRYLDNYSSSSWGNNRLALWAINPQVNVQNMAIRCVEM